MRQSNLTRAYEKIRGAKNVLLVTHNRPDGDGLASVCALAELLLSLEKNFFAYCLDQPPPQFSFLPHAEKISADRGRLDFAARDLIIALDCGSMSRTNLTREISRRSADQTVIEFDHHPKIDDYADIEIRDPGLSSTAEVLYHFFKTNGVRINKNIANCVLAGIMTDTGNFLYPSTTDATVKIASEMLTRGARFPTILEHTWRNKSLPAMKTWGLAINNLKVNKAHNFAYSILSREDIRQSGATDEELEGISGFLSSLHGVSGLVLLREEEDGKIKGSLRTTRPDIDISVLAQMLGGGGHAKASGFSLRGHLQNTNGRWEVV